MMLSRRLILCLLLSFAACTTAPKASLARINIGDDKGAVLDHAGDPKHSYRIDGRDHWVYQWFENGVEWHQEFVFQDGLVVRVIPPTKKDGFTHQLESADTMDEYEKIVREHQKKTP